jgi:hypothetical protein
MRLRQYWTLLLLLFTTACGSEPSAQNLNKELKTVISWAATAQMASQAWLQHRVPAVYAQQTLRKTQENLQAGLDEIDKVAPPQNRAIALSQVKRLQDTIQHMATGLERQDRATLTQNLRILSRQKQGIQTLVQTFGGQP